MFTAKKMNAVWAAICVVGLLAGCAQTNEAPVETRGGFNRVDPATLPGAENAGKPGYYTVKPGDTLVRIGLEHGQSWKDIARWSNLANPDVIEVGQVVRVVPPGPAPAQPAKQPVTPVASSTPVQGTALPPAGSAPAATVPAAADAASMNFIWPAAGSVVAGFQEQTNKGLNIGGKAGDPVVASAAGRVIHAGDARGYGQLVILQHNSTFITAYAHNQKLLVKEGQSVTKGQKIAEMGSTDADRVQLHFELRRQGQPLDPMRYLPKR